MGTPTTIGFCSTFAIALPFLGGIAAPELIIVLVTMLIMFGPAFLAAAVGVVMLVRQRRSTRTTAFSPASGSFEDGGIVVSEPLNRQAIVDEEHLRLLPVCYWVLGAVTAFLALYGLFYIGMGLLFAFAPGFGSSEDASLAFVSWIFIAMGAGFTLAGGTVATLQILTGFWLRQRSHRVGCLVMAGISCMFVPFGTLIGVFTFLTLLRPSVAALFESTSRAKGRDSSALADHGEEPAAQRGYPSDSSPV